MSTDWTPDLDDDTVNDRDRLRLVYAPGFPEPEHPAEAGVFVRHDGVPGHVQSVLTSARVTVVGAGGLGSWTALSLGRIGVRNLTVIDPDRFDRTNASRQLMFGDDIRQPKAFAVARNVAPHMIGGGTVTAIHLPFDLAVERYLIPTDLIIVVVDNNTCRYQAARIGRQWRVPVIFSMLSRDSMRAHTFLQGSDSQDPCLWCALPNLEIDAAAPCAAAVMTGCLVSAAYSTFFALRALMGWPEGTNPFNWRSSDLFGGPEETGVVTRRLDCRVCSSRGGDGEGNGSQAAARNAADD